MEVLVDLHLNMVVTNKIMLKNKGNYETYSGVKDAKHLKIVYTDV